MAEVVAYTKEGTDDLLEGAIVYGSFIDGVLTLVRGDDTTIEIPITISGGITQEDVDASIATLVDSAPATLNTLNELAAALGDNENFAAATLARLPTKVAVTGQALGSHAGGAGAFTWHEIPAIGQRMLLSLVKVTPGGAGAYDLELRDAGAGGGNVWLAAVGADGVYSYTQPVYVEGSSGGSLWLGVKNTGAGALSFTLDLRAEVFLA